MQETRHDLFKEVIKVKFATGYLPTYLLSDLILGTTIGWINKLLHALTHKNPALMHYKQSLTYLVLVSTPVLKKGGLLVSKTQPSSGVDVLHQFL